MNDAAVVLSCDGLRKHFVQGDNRIEVLRDVTLKVGVGETASIVGASGSGKSTLLHLLGGLDRPGGGVVKLLGRELARLSEGEIGVLRNQALGFVYQFHHLLPEFSALENVAMPLLIRRLARAEALEQARRVLGQVGLAQRLSHRPAQLSGGERQRVAIARALVTRPACLLADEPTGNLDRVTATTVFEQMLNLCAEHGTALIMVTHDAELAARTARVMHLCDGVLSESDTAAAKPPADASATPSA